MDSTPSAAAPMRFSRLPSLGSAYRRALLSRKRGLAPGESLPELCAELEPVVVSAGELRAYNRVCGFVATDVLPSTYPQLLATPLQAELLTSPRFPLRALGLIHVRNHIVEHTALLPGEPLALACRISGQRAVERGLELDLRTVVTRHGAPVWEAVSTVLAPGRRQGPPGRRPPRQRAPAADEAVTTLSAVWHIPNDAGRRYARVSGDYNPIHLYAPLARLFGFRGAIAHGNWTLARCVAALSDHLPAAPRVIEVAFKRPVLLPAQAVFSAAADDAGWRFNLRSARGGEVYLEGSMTHGASAS